MVFETAGNEWVHTSVMSGLAPVKTQDQILGLPEASDPNFYLMMSAEERAKLTPLRKAAYKTHKRDELIAEFRANNHAIEAIDTMESALGAGGEPHEQLVANEMVVTLDDPEFGATTQVGVPLHLASTPGAIRGPRPRAGEHSEAILSELGYSAADIAAISGPTHSGAA
jgi:crotonobetainyl-CoA:carnitine CoA-transferase CaiB-like acyl-CoA transferase